MMKRFTLVCCLLLLLNTYSTAKKIYVKLASDTEAWQHVVTDAENIIVTVSDGTFNSVVSQIQGNDIIWVAKGVYRNTATIGLNGTRAGVKLYGGFKGDETTLDQRPLSDKDGNGIIEPWEFTHETRFTGNTEGNATFRMFNIYSEGTSIDGVTIADHKHTSDHAAGAHIREKGTLTNSILINVGCEWERAGNAVNGGGLFVESGGKVENCLLENCYNINLATGGMAYGGAINIAGKGSSIKNCVVRNNKATSTTNAFGGGLFINNGADAENCVIYNNESGFRGGGIYVHNSASDPINLVNLTVVNNIATNAGGGIFNNRASSYIYNSVFWGNTNINGNPNNINLNASAYVEAFAYNGSQGSGIWMDGKNTNPSPGFTVLNAANNPAETTNENFPGFVRPTSFAGVSTTNTDEITKANWSLRHYSALIDKGVNEVKETAYTLSTKDICNNNRPVGTNYDLGAYELMALLNGEVIEEGVTSSATDLVLEGNWSAADYAIMNNLLNSEITSINLTQVTQLPASISENLNSNALIYLDEKAEEGFTQTNIIKGTYAETIELTDGLPFNAPLGFTAKSIHYTRLPENPNVWANGTEGWSTIILPFAANTYTASTKGNITPFTSVSDTEGAFWLKEYKDSDEERVYFDFPETIRMKANHPYIIALPGDHWGATHDLSNQSIIFSAENANIVVTSDESLSDTGSTENTYLFKGNYQTQPVSGYLLGEEQSTSNVFSLEENTPLTPFRAYFPADSQSARRNALYVGSYEDKPTTIHSDDLTSGELKVSYSANSLKIDSPIEQSITIYRIDGVAVLSVKLQEGVNKISNLSNGFYIIAGKKVIIN